MLKKIAFFIIISIILISYFLIFKYNIIQNDYTLKLSNDTEFSKIESVFISNNTLKNIKIGKIVNLFFKIKKVKSGRYVLNKGLSIYNLLDKLKYGKQDPVNFTISTATFIEDVSSKIGKTFMTDSLSFNNYIFSDSFLNSKNIKKENLLSIIYPNTYQIYWNSNPKTILDKIEYGEKSFWTESKKHILKKLNLSKQEMYILASLVQKEYNKTEERSRIAGVIYNRIKKSIPLQIDATCKYATKDFAAKRVLKKHLDFESPFNTYRIKGLPPGPICIPELSTIEDCLNLENHNYLFYCADPSLNGYHIFSETATQHENIANEYRDKMNLLKIK